MQPEEFSPEPIIPPPATPDMGLRAALAQRLHQQERIRSSGVLAAFEAVPRHLFLPDVPLDRAYADEAIVTKWDAQHQPLSSASQPAMIAIMLEQLDVRPGMRVLEIGAGTGYNAALLAHLAGPTGHVATIDIDPELVAAAQAHLLTAGLDAARVTAIAGDGAAGWAAGAPYDRIILTAGAWDVAPAWMAQLAEGGRIVLPLALHTAQFSIALDRRGDMLHSASIQPCGFIRLRGSFAGPETLLHLEGTTGLKLLVEPPLPQPAALAALLATAPRIAPLALTHSEWLRCTLAFTELQTVTLLAHPAHPLLGQAAIGVVTPEGDSACFLSTEVIGGRNTCIQVEYGAATAALCMERALRTWHALGDPHLDAWRLRLLPIDTAFGETSTDKQCFRIQKQHWVVEAWVAHARAS